jgi:hypothetical protein
VTKFIAFFSHFTEAKFIYFLGEHPAQVLSLGLLLFYICILWFKYFDKSYELKWPRTIPPFIVASVCFFF